MMYSYEQGKKDAKKEIAKELREIINDRACQDFVTLKAEMTKLAEQLDGEKVKE